MDFECWNMGKAWVNTLLSAKTVRLLFPSPFFGKIGAPWAVDKKSFSGHTKNVMNLELILP
jgi:hypothetical protein